MPSRQIKLMQCSAQEMRRTKTGVIFRFGVLCVFGDVRLVGIGSIWRILPKGNV
jgi:hypothetical protein